MMKNNQPVLFIIKRPRREAEHHGGAWKVAYADFVTAMMAFFLLLWLLSVPDEERLKGIAQYFQPTSPSTQAGVGANSLDVASTNDGWGAAVGSAPEAELEVGRGPQSLPTLDVRVALLALPEAQAYRSNLRIDNTTKGLRIQLMDTVDRPMFRSGSAVLNPTGVEMLQMVARSLGQRGARISVEGHTDRTGGNADTNWALSSARANAARKSLVASGVAGDRIAEVVGFAGTRPLFPDEPDRPENRRITLVLLSEQPLLPDTLA